MRWLLRKSEREALGRAGIQSDPQSLLDILEELPGDWGLSKILGRWTFWKDQREAAGYSRTDPIEAIIERLCFPRERDEKVKLELLSEPRTLKDLWHRCTDTSHLSKCPTEERMIHDIYMYYEGKKISKIRSWWRSLL